MIRKACLLLIFILLVSCYPVYSMAAAPDDAVKKGERPASTLVVDSVTPDDTERPEPRPVDIETLYIGLAYDSSAVKEARLVNAEGKGFFLGTFDENRCFCPSETLEYSALILRREQNWYVLLDEIYPSKESALAYLQTHFGRVIELEGEYRIVIGPFNKRGEAEYTIRQYALSGSCWIEPCLAIYDSAYRLRYLHTGNGALAIRAQSNNKPVTEYNGRRYSGDFMFLPWDGEHLTVINALGLEDYVKGVVPYEMNAGWPIEAMKAQAVCARTYAVFNLYEYMEDYGFDLTADTYSQVYRGMNAANAVSDAAVDSTAGQFVRYQGELCEIYYFSSDGGATEDGLHIFGSDRPYLAGKTDPFESAVDHMVLRWEQRFTGEEIARRLTNSGYPVDTVIRIEAKYSELGNVIGMVYYDESGNCLDLDTRESYKPLALESCRFTVSKDKDEFVFTGIGWGHNCGMSQWGAYAMADTYGMTAEDIIEFYFTGAYIG